MFWSFVSHEWKLLRFYVTINIFLSIYPGFVNDYENVADSNKFSYLKKWQNHFVFVLWNTYSYLDLVR